jgi:putative molybdopterin biosynthesis protein
VILSGGTSKGAGDLTHRLVSRLGSPGIVAHGVALKPGKPLCLAVCDGKAVVVLPGFPTSAMFTFHDVVAPVLRRLAGLPARPETTVAATVPMRVPPNSAAPSSSWRRWSSARAAASRIRPARARARSPPSPRPTGFFAVDALADAVPAGADGRGHPVLAAVARARSGHHRQPRSRSRRGGRTAFSTGGLASGSSRSEASGGLAAEPARRMRPRPDPPARSRDRGLQPSFLAPGLELVEGGAHAGRGVPSRRPRFEGRRRPPADRRALTAERLPDGQPQPGAGTRILIDGLLGVKKPDGYWNQPRSHNAVAACVARGGPIGASRSAPPRRL